MKSSWKSFVFQRRLVLVLTVAYFLALWPFTPGLASPRNLMNLLSSLLPLLVAAIGQTCVLITGGIDLSATSAIALGSVVGASLITADGGFLAGSPLAVPAGALAMALTGLLIGLLNGAAVSRLRMPPFIVTLTVMMMGRGLAVWYTGSRPIHNLPPAFNAIGGLLPAALVLTGTLALAAHLLLSRTLFGRWLFAIGHNRRAAEISGVPVAGTLTLAYVLSGLCAGVAAILYTGRLETGSPVYGERVFLDVVGAAVIGGTSLSGGKGDVPGALFGALFLTLIDNSLNLLGLTHFSISMVKGGVILLAALLDSARERMAAAG